MLMHQFYFFASQRWFLQYIFGRVIRRNHHKYIPCSLLIPFHSQSRMISGLNISLSQSLAISSAVWLEEPWFSDHYIAEEQPDETTGFFVNPPQFLNIFALVHILLSSTIISPGLFAREIWFWANFIISFALDHHIQHRDENRDWCSTPICLNHLGLETLF